MNPVDKILGKSKKRKKSEEELDLIEGGILSHHIRDERYYE